MTHAPAAGLPPAVLLMGPTASGKTALALEVARRIPVEIVSVDSAQVSAAWTWARPSQAPPNALPCRII